MIISIDHSQRVFHVQSQGLGKTKDFFCNLDKIPSVLVQEFETNEEFKVRHFWNRTWKVCSKKYLNEMFVSNQIDYKIK